MPTADPYVPAIIRNVPDTTTNPLNNTIKIHFFVRSIFPWDQLSYSHIHPYGWNDMRVPRRAPINETRPSNTGIPLAIM